MTFPLSASNKEEKPKPAPVISEEADRVIGRVLIRWGMLTFILGVILPVLCGIAYYTHPHDKLLGPNGPLFYGSVLIWLITFYIGMTKTSKMRLDYGRKYVQEGSWKEAAASLASFKEFGQRSFDRTGEGHYLMAQAYDKLGRKAEAEKMREFVRKHRAGTEWAIKLGGKPAGAQAQANAPAHTLRKGVASDGDSPVEVRKRSAANKGRRRRF